MQAKAEVKAVISWRRELSVSVYLASSMADFIKKARIGD